jgi:hypothetical protein
MLLKRVTHSVTRLNTVMEQLTTELAGVEGFQEDVDMVHSIWKGYDRRLGLALDNSPQNSSGDAGDRR